MKLKQLVSFFTIIAILSNVNFSLASADDKIANQKEMEKTEQTLQEWRTKQAKKEPSAFKEIQQKAAACLTYIKKALNSSSKISSCKQDSNNYSSSSHARSGHSAFASPARESSPVKEISPAVNKGFQIRETGPIQESYFNLKDDTTYEFFKKRFKRFFWFFYT